MHHREVKRKMFTYLYEEFWFEEGGKTVFSFSATAIKPFRVELWAETRFCFVLFFLLGLTCLSVSCLRKPEQKIKSCAEPLTFALSCS